MPSAYHPDHGPRVFANLAYVRAVEDAGGLVILTGRPHEEADLDALIDLADGLFLMGGLDVEPPLYGKKTCAHVKNVDPARDEIELSLLARAEKKGMSVFGICRGLQVMNIYAGGGLFRDLADEHPGAVKHDHHGNPDRTFLAHEAVILENSFLASLVGSGTFGVNSLHHQGIDKIGARLTASATSPDGLIEAIERPELPFWLGVQWHPEELADPVWKKLFAEFVTSAAHSRTGRETQKILNELEPTVGQ